MKKSLCRHAVLMFILHLCLIGLLLWVVTVSLDQLRQYAAGFEGKIINRPVDSQNIDQIGILIWSAITLTAAIGFAFSFMIFRQVLNPILSIRDTLRQISREDLKSRIQVRSGIEIESLANELNRVLDNQQHDMEKLLDLNLTLSGICACHHVLIQQNSEKQVIQECCQLLVDIAAYRLAWIGYAEGDGGRTIYPAAMALNPHCRQQGISDAWSEAVFSPVVRAVRNRHPAIINNVLGDPLYASLVAEATQIGYASVMALPISTNQRFLGTLTLYAEKPDAFGTEQVRLLTALADDMAHRMNSFQPTDKMITHPQPLP